MQSVIEPGKIAAIYCRGKRDLHENNVLINTALWTEDAAHRLKNRFGFASDRFSLASAEAYLEHLGHDRKTIKDFTLIVKKTAEIYMKALAESDARFPEFTLSRNYYLGFHMDGKPLTEEAVIEEFEIDVRRLLVLQRNGSSPLYTGPRLVSHLEQR